MDELIAAIIGGVVATVVGAILAYYFGGVRERQKQLYAEQSDQQKQINEKEEELKKRRADALLELQTRGRAMVEDLRSWADNAARIPALVEKYPTSYWKWLRSPSGEPGALVTESLQILAEIVQQRDFIAEAMKSLRDYYAARKPYLSPTERSLFEAFDKDFYKRYTPLAAQIPDYETIRQYFKADKEDVTDPMEKLVVFALQADEAGTAQNIPAMQILREQSSGIPEAAGHARDWNFHKYEAAITKEIEILGVIPTLEP